MKLKVAYFIAQSELQSVSAETLCELGYLVPFYPDQRKQR